MGKSTINIYKWPFSIAMLVHQRVTRGTLSGEAYLIRLGAFGMFGHTASWRIIDLSKGVVREGTMTTEMMPGSERAVGKMGF